MVQTKLAEQEANLHPACEVCLKEVPESAAFTPEGSEYVGHFCGIECYQAFVRKQREAAKQDVE